MSGYLWALIGGLIVAGGFGFALHCFTEALFDQQPVPATWDDTNTDDWGGIQ